MNGDVVVVDDDDDLLDAVADLVESTTDRRVLKARSVAELMTLGPRALACALAILDVNLGANAPSGLDALSWLNDRDFKGRAFFLTGHGPSLQLLHDAHIPKKESNPRSSGPSRSSPAQLLLCSWVKPRCHLPTIAVL